MGKHPDKPVDPAKLGGEPLGSPFTIPDAIVFAPSTGGGIYGTGMSTIGHFTPIFGPHSPLAGSLELPFLSGGKVGVGNAFASLGESLGKIPYGSELVSVALGKAEGVGQSPKEKELRKQIVELRQEISGLTAKLNAKARIKGQTEGDEKAVRSKYDELLELERAEVVSGLLPEDAKAAFAKPGRLRAGFMGAEARDAFVLSVDIRRSTDLMLKAQTAQAFAEFLTGLTLRLSAIVARHFGIFDKFTGDGILAYFPEFYTGKNAGYHAVSAADECHRAFEEHYRQMRSCFAAVPSAMGLGIGIDAGPVHIVKLREALTVVGRPVVYACRLAGGPATTTTVNQRAFELLSKRHSAEVQFDEVTFPIKHEGEIVVHRVKLLESNRAVSAPSWYKAPITPARSAAKGKTTRKR